MCFCLFVSERDNSFGVVKGKGDMISHEMVHHHHDMDMVRVESWHNGNIYNRGLYVGLIYFILFHFWIRTNRSSQQPKS